MAEHGTILYLEGVTVSFDGFKALQDVDFYVDHGELPRAGDRRNAAPADIAPVELLLP